MIAPAPTAPAVQSPRSKAAFLRHDDVFVRDLASGTLHQITRTAASEARLQWAADGKALQYKIDQDWYSHDLNSGTTSSVAVVMARTTRSRRAGRAGTQADAPVQDPARHQRGQDARRTREIELDKADGSRSGLKFWLGKYVKIVDTRLSPDGDRMLVVTEPASHKSGKQPVVNRYVTDRATARPRTHAPTSAATIRRRNRCGCWT